VKVNFNIFFAFIPAMMFASFAFAQPYNNEWIVPAQTYYKIPVGKSGLYAVTLSDVLSASGNDPRKMQIWHRGVEQAIMVKGESDGNFGSLDSLFFYGEMNDGTMDTPLYITAADQPHKYYNLYSDTSAYFLTWALSGSVKRMSQLTGATTSQPIALYHINEDLMVFSDSYDGGQPYQESYLSGFDQGEGWFGNSLLPAGQSYTLNASDLYTSGPSSPTLEIMLVGRNDNKQSVEITLGSGSNAIIDTVDFTGHTIYKFNTSLAFNNFTSAPAPDITITCRPILTVSLVSLAYIKLNFPQAYNMQGLTEKYFTLPQNPQDTTFIQISNPPSPAYVFDITDKNNIRLVPYSIQSGLMNVIVDSMAARPRNLYVSSTALPAAGIKAVDLSAYLTSGNYIIVTHEKLLTSALSSATTYANYRSSPQGGGNTVVIAEINKLYNMFSYGEKSPQAIRRFADYLLDHGKPEYLLLLGKGVSVNANIGYNVNGVYKVANYRTDPVAYKSNPDPYYNHLIDDLIPPAGYPGSDILYTMGLDSVQGVYMPAIATGRVSARNDAEVIQYLNKIIEHENLDSNWLWRKNLVHLSGGDDVGQISDFKSWIGGLTMKGVAEGPNFGGRVIKSFSKEAPGSVDESFREGIKDEVNKGISYLTFLGHASPAITDIDLGFVSFPIYEYQNKGKYPMLLMNGCSSANCFNYYSFSEDWLLTPDKGAIAIIGHTDIGYPTLLEPYSERFYKAAFVDTMFIGKAIGMIQKQVLKLFTTFYNVSSYPEALANVEQMILHGDPYVSIYHPSKTDYSIIKEGSQEQVIFIKSYNGKPVTAVSDSFEIGILVTNFGRAAVKDSFAVTVTRTINSKTVITYGPVMYPAIYYQDTIYFKIKSKDASTFGENLFLIKVDALNSIVEMSEDNNGATLEYFIPLSAVIALLPHEYSIVNNTYLNNTNTITLVAQATDLLIGLTDFYLEIDTSYLFKFPLDKTTINSGSLIKWNPSPSVIRTTQDSVVYYWRVRFANIPPGQDTLWGESSFIYIGGSPEGWSQSKYPQFTKDELSHIILNVPQNKWEFEKVNTKMYIQSVGNNGASTLINIDGTALNFSGLYGASCGGAGIIAMAFDKSTALPVIPNDASIGTQCGRDEFTILRGFSQTSDSLTTSANGATQSSLIAYIDSIPTGDYILLVADGPGYFSNWGQPLKNKLKAALGSTLIDSLNANYGYVILAKKGNGGTLPMLFYENFNKVPGGQVILDTTITGTYNHGTITSTLIGPTDQWGSMFRDIRIPDASDKYTLKVKRLNIDGSTKDINTIPAFGYKFDLDSFFHTLSDTNLFPYIKLVAEFSDSMNLTPPQLDKWQVVYREVPEGTLVPTATGNIAQYNFFTKEEGEKVPLSFVFENISKIDFPKQLKVRFTITNQSGHTLTDTITLIALQKGNQVTFNYSINSVGFEGTNVFEVFVNPWKQPEQYYDNNILQIFFTIEKDKTNPILDVAFDGQHIMNGDIVSPSPLISINLNDENKFLIKNDTLNMQVFLQRPGQTTPEQINMTSTDIVSWGHITGSSNTFRIEYHPKNLPDGTYTLITQGSDVTGNKSALQRYEIKFEVINEVAITYFYPYPNPFSSSTRFVFTLTGNEIPEDMKIQIMTVTGKVIREITKSEIGPMHIGNNKTDYAWDGTDEFGDRLANGVYLYRVILKGADDFKHRQTAGDKAFKKDWGKLYILR
jgi:hypothetical protein